MKDYRARMIKADFSAIDEIISPDWFTHVSPGDIHEAFLEVIKACGDELAFFQQVTGVSEALELLLNKMMARPG